MKHKFKVGQKVKVTGSSHHNLMGEGVITEENGICSEHKSPKYYLNFKEGRNYTCEIDMEELSFSSEFVRSFISHKRRLKDEDLILLKKYDLIADSLDITEKGRDLILSYLLHKNIKDISSLIETYEGKLALKDLKK